MDTESWVIRQDGSLNHNQEEKARLPEVPQEGDILVRNQSLILYVLEKTLSVTIKNSKTKCKLSQMKKFS